MPAPNTRLTIFWMTYLEIIFISIFLSSCSQPSQPREQLIHYPTFTSINESAALCVDVHGHVLGSVHTNATVYLYCAQTLEFDSVMRMARTSRPWKIIRINKSNEFSFSCLAEGQYIFAIPAISFHNRSVGSPLPYEVATKNYFIFIHYQGGDSDYLVGAFSINKTDRIRP